MKLKLHTIDLDRRVVTYSVWDDAETIRLFGVNEADIPPGANTLAEIKSAVRPQARLVGQSLKAFLLTQSTEIANIDTDPLP